MGMSFITWSVILYIVVIVVVIIGGVTIRMNNNKRKREARQRGYDESLRIKKRQARRLINKQGPDFKDEKNEVGREVLGRRDVR